MGWAAVAIALIAGVLGWFLGPWVVSVAFGSEFTPDRIDALAISVGVVFAGAGLFVGQILVARGESVRLAIAWFGALAASVATIILASTAGPITRVGLGFAAGAAFALLALVWGAVLTRKADRTERGSLAGYLLTKRTLDIAVALTLLILTTPVLVLAGIAVRIDSKGPIFFRQMRIGRDAKAFGLLKIRTMQADADEAVFAEHLERLEAARHSETGPPIRIDDDDRVTRIGAVLRRWSIDELPNFWNVLKGSMSLVGPRPLVPAEAELVGLNSSRFQVKPGITGLAQVHGRDAITMAERTRLDEEYVESRSGRLDLKILTLTAKTVFTEPGE
jgi:lipopolysaccharide/colanic/teichoic acid biosynthesis glycosyltransferase